VTVVVEVELGADLAARVLRAVDVDVGQARLERVEELVVLARVDALAGRSDDVLGPDRARDGP